MEFRTRKDGSHHPITPAKGMDEKTFDRLQKWDLERRSALARKIDSMKKAPLDSDGSKWQKNPNRYDIKGIDAPGESSGKHKTTLPALESMELYKKDQKSGLHPVFQEHVKKNYPPEKWVPRGTSIQIIGKKDDHKFFGKSLKPIYRPYEVYGEGKNQTAFQIGNLQEWLAKHGISWYEYMNWQSKPRRTWMTERILKAIIAEKTKNEDPKKIKLVPIKKGEKTIGYKFEDLRTAEELFVEDVEAGKVKDDKGLKLSRSQAYGQVPEGGYLNRMTMQLVGGNEGAHQKMTDAQKNLGYYKGLVVKITGDYDPALRDDHNTWGVITDIVDNYHYKVQQEDGKKLTIRDTDVKGWIGDANNDFIGIGKERHAKEVKPFIAKALRGK